MNGNTEEGNSGHEHPLDSAEAGSRPEEDDRRSACPVGGSQRRRFRLSGRVLGVFAAAITIYLFAAYLAMPAYRKWHARSLHPALREIPFVAVTRAGAPGDPLNIVAIATDVELTRAMLAAKWYPADATTLESSRRIAEGVLLRRPSPDAPVNALCVWSRPADKTFERPVGHDPRHRHCVRFWRSDKTDGAGRPLWAGSATYDMCVELGRAPDRITHHIAPDVDAEREKLVGDLRGTRFFDRAEYLKDFQPRTGGRNGDGDPYRTDRMLAIVLLRMPT